MATKAIGTSKSSAAAQLATGVELTLTHENEQHMSLPGGRMK